MKLTEKELIRYSCHLVLPGFGLAAQEKLKDASVLVVGAGGLGCPALLYLAAAGVGKIGIADFDIIQESNLQRQVLYTTGDLGHNKAESAAVHLRQRNPHIEVIAYPIRITAQNAPEVFRPYQVIVDGSDNFATRYLINDVCVVYDKPFVYGSILQYEGHVSVFNVPDDQQGRSANYRDIFPQPPSGTEIPNCAEAGVLGVLPGIVGCIMANEVLKLLTGRGNILTNRLLIVDAWTLDFTTIRIRPQYSREKISIQSDYDVICSTANQPDTMKEVTVQELKNMMDNKIDFQLIDVREPHENQEANLGGELIPMSEVPYNINRIARDKMVIIHCRSGGRSGNIIQWLERNHGFKNLYNLKGGILAWAREIDPEMDVP